MIFLYAFTQLVMHLLLTVLAGIALLAVGGLTYSHLMG